MTLKGITYKAWRINISQKWRGIMDILLFGVVPVAYLFMGMTKPEELPATDSPTYYPKLSKKQLMSPSSLYVAYTPDSPLVSQLMGHVNASIGGSYVALASSKEIENYFIKNFEDTECCLFGVEFGLSQSDVSLPSHVSVKLRTAMKNLPSKDLFSFNQSVLLKEPTSKYISSKFLGVEAAVGDALLTVLGLPPANYTLEQFPLPAQGEMDSRLEVKKLLVAFFIVLFGISVFICLALFEINERVSGFAERVRMTGISDSHLLLSYLLFCLMKCLVATVLLTMLLKMEISGFAVLDKSNPLAIWLVLIVFSIQAAAFFLCLSCFFTNTSLATLMLLIIHVLLFVLFAFVLGPAKIPVVGQVLTSTFPSVFLYWTFYLMFTFEEAQTGATLGSLVKVPQLGHCGVPILGLIAWALFSAVVFSLLYIYIRNVKPGPYGFAKHWTYIFPKRWCGRKARQGELIEPKDKSKKTPLVESAEGSEVGLRIEDLRKSYGDVQSVRGVTLDIYVGQITALLGHNGAGKTTTLSMITGMISPSSGKVEYLGEDVFADLKGFRRKVGLCPQEDMLLNNITVWDHLLIFGMLEGMRHSEVKKRAAEVLKEVNLEEKRKVKVKKLSGGMKRRLCLALALLSAAPVLVLDEPSSGLDPESRRELWDYLLTLREDRVMIITTHFMEEADALGDRIAVMAHGQLKCYGTQMFLKKHYGAGYEATVVCSEADKRKMVVDSTSSTIPGSSVTPGSQEGLLTLRLPAQQSHLFPEFFKKLEPGGELAVDSFSLTVTTMDDVFLRVLEEDEREGDGADRPEPPRQETVLLDGNVVDPGQEEETPRAEEEVAPTEEEEEGVKKTQLSLKKDQVRPPSWTQMYPRKREVSRLGGFSQRFTALFMKNVRYTLGSWLMAFFVLLLNIAIVLFLFLALDTKEVKLQSQAAVTMDLKLYGAGEVFLVGGERAPLAEHFRSLIQDAGHTVLNKEPDLHQDILEAAKEEGASFYFKKTVAADFATDVPNLLYSWHALHSPAVLVGAYYNALLRSNGSQHSISIVNHPLDSTEKLCDLSVDQRLSVLATAWCCITLGPVFFICYCFISSPHSERLTLLKHLQLMAGVSPLTYWLSFFLWDLIQAGFCVLLFLLLVYLVDPSSYLAVDNGTAASVFLLVLVLSVVSICWLTYLFSFLFKASTTGSEILINLFIVTLITVNIFYWKLYDTEYMKILYIFRILAFCPMICATLEFVFTTTKKLKCSNCPYANKMSECDADLSYFQEAMKRELYFLLLDGLLYFLFVMLLEFGILPRLWSKLRSVGPLEDGTGQEGDDDVKEEKERVRRLRQLKGEKEETDWPLLTADELGKKYSKTMTAVYDVTFAVGQGECFGLLGVNGAGKSTTFKMLTGLIRPTRGTALIRGLDVARNTRKYLELAGYCPQSSVIGEKMTGRQMLTLFAKLRLVRPSELKQVVNRWISLLDLEEFKDRQASTYSGGNKRKLNTAMAFINNPDVVLLDEPTSGVDPKTRRSLWSVIKESQGNRQAVVISSHSMDECEATCGRLTIMVNGWMRCVGGVARLKQKYGVGFVLLVKLTGGHGPAELAQLREDITVTFGPKAQLRDQHITLLHYFIADPSYRLSALFAAMEGVRERHTTVEDYTVSNSTLEQVFLSFAKKNQ